MQGKFAFQRITDGLVVGKECGVYACRISRNGISRIGTRTAETYIPTIAVVEIDRAILGDVNKAVGIEILKIGFVLALVGRFVYRIADACRAKARSYIRIPRVTGGGASCKAADTRYCHLVSERRMAKVFILVQSIMQPAVRTFPHLVGHAVAVDVYKGDASFVVRLGVRIRTARINRRRTPAGPDHDTATYCVSFGRAAAEKGKPFVKVPDVQFNKPAIVVLFCRINYGRIGENAFCYVIIITERLCCNMIVFTI